MFRLSNLVTALFGIIAALGAILGITSLGSVNRTATELGDPSVPGAAPADSASPSDGVASLTAPNSSDPAAPRQVGQNAASTGTPIVTEDGSTSPENPTAEFVAQGEGAVLTADPTQPTTPSEATAVQLDPSPGVATATVPAPVAQAPEATPAPAPAPAPVRAMW